MNFKKIGLLIGIVSITAGAYFLYQQYKVKHAKREIIQDIVDIARDLVLESIEQAQENNVEQSVETAAQEHQEPKSMIEITSPDMLHDVMNKKEPAVIFFHMTNCGWCKKMDPVYDEVAKNSKFASIQFYKANGKDCNAQVIVKELCDQQIQGFPTLIFMNEGGYLDKQVGFADQEKFEQKISTLFFGKDEKSLPAEIQEEADADNVTLQGCGDIDAGCTGGAGGSNGNQGSCCGGQDLNCFVCCGVPAANGGGGQCANYKTNTGCVGCSGCVGYGGICYGDYNGINNGQGNCCDTYRCMSSNTFPGTDVYAVALSGEQGSCQFCGTQETINNITYCTNGKNGPQTCVLACYNQEPCTGGGTSNEQGNCCGGYVCLTTNTESLSQGSYVELAGNGVKGACFVTTGMEKETEEAYNQSYWVSTQGPSDYNNVCSQVNTLCVGAYEGAIGTCCPGMNCLVTVNDVTTIATYGEVGKCVESQQSEAKVASSCTVGSTGAACLSGYTCYTVNSSGVAIPVTSGSGYCIIDGGTTGCIGTSNDVQGTCASGYACVSKTSEGELVASPVGDPGYCIIDNGEYGTQYQCSDDNHACVGGTGKNDINYNQGTCCPNYVCTTSSSGSASAYAGIGDIGVCSALVSSGSACLGNAYNSQGNCEPSLSCTIQIDSSTTINAGAGATGTCSSGSGTCASIPGQGCTAQANSKQGNCCPGENLICATSSTWNTSTPVAITYSSTGGNANNGFCAENA